ncbi:MAG TPA: biotin transporter BioY [Syntrophothermus lipocalidus]|uniref:Biotin transporter n=1 Tax=Syntrophothermus lipocalidus (strain DSM 12680 / TGB-C1) TaxID=643648 RepID=D7CJ53_SYNLT|nr:MULTISPECIES: biotin transporter BioY [Syntrophothermus]ADI00942.1 BioY protein [Syntrophothermus lipocalidus DSM 12680]NSW82972.1 biotin transporter BioY [Syntrophothermus sp.]HHV76093.1 biotin transporter BioY [Syntrophothermus lipocalidus]HOV42444.1 biotin transporter BioY [Syntrophothermus lipocalidus]
MRFSTKEIVMAGMFAAFAAAVAVVFRLVQPVLVPFSLLPVVVLLAGGLLPKRVAAASMMVYTLLGLVGLPVFASPPYGGPVYVLKPSFGFILGFGVAAYLVAWIIEKLGRRRAAYLLASVAGILAIYAVGLPYLYLILKFYLGQAVDVYRVLKIGFWPFIGLDLIKAGIASVIIDEVSKRVTILEPQMDTE